MLTERRQAVSSIGDALFWGSLFQGLDRRGPFLQLQIRQLICTAIEEGRLALGVRMPSSRELATLLEVSRNTVVIAYEQLVDQNFLVSRERSGFYVAGLPKHLGTQRDLRAAPDEAGAARWAERFAVRPSANRNISKPLNWQDYPYPFIFGQSIRACSRPMTGAKARVPRSVCPRSIIGHVTSSTRTTRR
ncbi:MAG: winged helix-turn-helix domain-containing protein [Pseudorhodoplanes sp.]